VPSYKERHGLARLLPKLAGYDIIAVIDGDDGSLSVAADYCRYTSYSETKRGYGGALKDGLQVAYSLGYEYATVVDIGTCDPEHIAMQSSADILVRAREFDKVGLRAILSRVGAAVMSVVMSNYIPDATSGYRTYKLKAVIGLLPLLRTNGHATNLELLGLAIKAGRTIEYKSVPYLLDDNTQLKGRDILEAFRVARDLKRGAYDLSTISPLVTSP